MGELVSYMFTSLDGYIADRDGALDWVPIDDELMRFANDYFAPADGIVFGRNVYEGFVEYWDGLDPGEASELEVEFAGIFRGMTRIVASRTLGELGGDTHVIGDDMAGQLSALKDRARRDLLLICGPELRSALATLGLIDRYRVLVAPVVLGSGIRQFGDADDLLRLRLTATRRFMGGVVLLDYEPASAA